MTGVGLTGKVKRGEWLTAADEHYEPMLRSASFVIQVDIEPEDARRTAQALGYRYAKVLNHYREAGYATSRAGQEARRVLRRRPAALVIAMVGIASSRYSANSYWPGFFEEAGLPLNAENERAFGTEFLDALRHLGLPTFGHVYPRFVGPVLMHAGLPGSCVQDLARLLIERRRADAGLDGRGFLLWGLNPVGPQRLANLDAPVRRFLHDGGDFARELIDRILKVLDFLDNNSDTAGFDFALVTTGLPRTVITALVAGFGEGFARPIGDRWHSGREQAAPVLGYDHSTNTVVLNLPEVPSEDGSTLWSIQSAGRTVQVESVSDWFDTDSAPATSHNITTPTTLIRVTNPSADIRAQVALSSVVDPAVYFDHQGRFLPAGRALPAGLCWALLPPDRFLIDQDNQRIDISLSNGEPLGWVGWTVVQADLSQTIEVHCAGPNTVGRGRPVQRKELPTIELGQPIIGVTTDRGDVVYAHRPFIHLPSGSGVATDWKIGVSRLGVAFEPQRVTRTTIEESLKVDPFEAFSGKIMGRFAVTVAGPDGRSAKETVTLVEGLTLQIEPGVRLLTARGLQSARALVGAPEELHLSESLLDFDPEVSQRRVTVAGGKFHLELQVEPPHMAISAIAPGVQTGWTTAPIALTSEAVGGSQSVSVRWPGAESASLQVEGLDRSVSQLLQSEGRRLNGEFNFGLVKLADTIRTTRRANLFAVTATQRVLVARVRPELRATGAEPTVTGLQLTGYSHRAGDRVAVYCRTAPWLGALVCTVDRAGHVELPDDAGISGDLVIEIAEDCGWGVPWPTWPADDAIVVQRPGFRYGADAAERRLSALLAETYSGHHLLPGTDLEQVWITLNLLDRVLPASSDRMSVETELRRTLQSAPTEARAALALIDVRAVGYEELLQRAGLAEQAPAEPQDPETRVPVPVPVPAPLTAARDDEARIKELRPARGEWYLAKVYERHEMTVKAKLEERISANALGDEIYEVAVPVPPKASTPVTLTRKPTKKNDNPYSGYLLVRMELNDTTYGLVRNTPGVTQFKSTAGTWPLPLDLDEVITFLGLKSDGPDQSQRTESAYRVGGSVMVLDGPFRHQQATVEGVNEVNRTLKLSVNFLGRRIPFELTFDQVELKR